MIRALTFKGGVRIDEHKELTEQKAIQTLTLPPRVFIPLRQNAGQPPTPVVVVDQAVKAGEVIARPSAPVSTTHHASVAGTVKAIGLYPYPAGPAAVAIEIETDPAGQPEERLPPLREAERLSPEAIRRRVLEAGIVGMGGAGFPTQIKLTPPPGTRIEYAIINGSECEPFLTVDHRLMLEETDKVIRGLRLVMRATGADRGLVAIEANKPDAFKRVRERLGGAGDIQVRFLQVKYPQGGEKQLIYSLLRRKVPIGGLPSVVGCVVQNVHTAVAIAEAVEDGKPLIERVVTVTGPELKTPGNFRVRIGTPFSHLVAAAGGIPEGKISIIAGGPMMGIAQCRLDAPVIKGTSGLVILKDVPRTRNFPCIRCGRCLTVCSMGLLPSDLARSSERKDWERFKVLGGDSCIECGCCAYVCPAERDLVQFVQGAKAQIKK